MRRLAMLIMALTLVTVSGCSRPTEQPEPTDPIAGHDGSAPAQAADPIIRRRTVYRDGPGDHGVREGVNQFMVNPDTEVIVGSGAVVVTWQFDPMDTEFLKERVRSAGSQTVRVDASSGMLQAHFAAGGPQRWEVWLDGVVRSRIILVRQPEPVVRVTYRHAGGDEVMIEGNELVLPPGPLRLEFRFDQPMDESALHTMAAASLARSGDPLLPGAEVEWLSPQHARWNLMEVPSRLELVLSEFRTVTGLLAVPRPLVVRSEAVEPYLERVHVRAGQRERVMAMPPEIMAAHLSPGGRFIALRTWEERSDSNQNRRPTGTWAADLQEKHLARAPLEAVELMWRPDGTLLNFKTGYGGPDAGWDSWDPASDDSAVEHPGRISSASVSPDGNYAAFLDLRVALSATYGLDTSFPVPLVIVDLETGREQVIPEFVTGWHWGKGDGAQWVAWSPDGQMIAALDPIERTARTDLVAYDLRTAARQVLRERVNVGPRGYRLDWSPDGRSILAVESFQRPQVIPLDGSPLINLPGFGIALWDGSGSRILYTKGEWKEVYAFTPATAQVTNLGSGWPVGWQDDWVYIIRWVGSDRRYVPRPY